MPNGFSPNMPFQPQANAGSGQTSGPDLSHLLEIIKNLAGNYFSGFNKLRAPQAPSGLPMNPMTAAAVRAGGSVPGQSPAGPAPFVGPLQQTRPMHRARPHVSPLQQAIQGPQAPQANLPSSPVGDGLMALPAGLPSGVGMEDEPLSSSPTSWGQFGPEQNSNAMNGMPSGLGGQPGLSDSHPGKLQALLRAILGRQ